jgi:hypothetical protein
MKPNSQTSRQPSRLDAKRFSSGRRSIYPHTRQAFRAPLSEMLSTAKSSEQRRSVPVPGFRDISNEFLGTEMKRTYAAEALFFAVIVGISAWPIVSTLQAMAQFIK